MRKILSPLNPKHEKYEAYAARIQELARNGNDRAIAEIMSGFIQGVIELEDPVAAVLGEEYNWTDRTAQEQLFEAPPTVTNNKAVTFENGYVIPTARFRKNKIGVSPEYIATPGYEIDVNTLANGNIVDLAFIQDKASQSLVIEKVLRLYRLLGFGDDMTDTYATGSRVIAIEDDGEFSSATDDPTYIRTIKRIISDGVSELSETVNQTDVQIRAMCRKITLDFLADTATNSISWHAVPAASDEITQRPYITEGDILLVAPYAANVARTLDPEAGTKQIDYWTNGYSWRAAYKWIRWATKYLRRYVVVKKNVTGTIEMDYFSKDEMGLYFSKPVGKSTIKAAITVTDAEGTEVEDAVDTVEVLYDLRQVKVTFASGKLSAGSTYTIAVAGGASGVKDIVGGTGHDYTALSATVTA